jgi:hypothetical protein
MQLAIEMQCGIKIPFCEFRSLSLELRSPGLILYAIRHAFVPKSPHHADEMIGA